jgi:amino acid transporter
MTEAPTFSRTMKTFGALLITLSSVTPASSIFVVVPGVVQQAGTGAIYSFIAGAVVSLFVAYVYAELSSAFPLTGGEYAIVGRLMGPESGFVVMGVNTVALMLAVSSIALGIGDYVAEIVPGFPASWAGILCVILTTACAILNVRTNALITGIFLAVELLALAVLSALGLLHPVRDLIGMALHPVVAAQGGGLAPATFGVIALATPVAIFAFNGFGNAVYLGEECHDAPRQVAKATLLALAVGVVTEAVPLGAALIGAPDLAKMLGSATMFADFVRQRGGPVLAGVMDVSVALAIINANIAFMVLISRLLFSTGRDLVWNAPVNQFLTLISRRFGSPWGATIATGVLSAFGCFVPLNTLLVLTGTTIVFVYIMLCIAVMVGRRGGGTVHGHYRMPFYPWPPLLALGAMAYVLYADLFDPDSGRPSLIFTGVIIGISGLYYQFVLRQRGDWVLRGPDEEIAAIIEPG